jgi:hypothetical protein
MSIVEQYVRRYVNAQKAWGSPGISTKRYEEGLLLRYSTEARGGAEVTWRVVKDATEPWLKSAAIRDFCTIANHKREVKFFVEGYECVTRMSLCNSSPIFLVYSKHYVDGQSTKAGNRFRDKIEGKETLSVRDVLGAMPFPGQSERGMVISAHLSHDKVKSSNALSNSLLRKEGKKVRVYPFFSFSKILERVKFWQVQSDPRQLFHFNGAERVALFLADDKELERSRLAGEYGNIAVCGDKINPLTEWVEAEPYPVSNMESLERLIAAI